MSGWFDMYMHRNPDLDATGSDMAKRNGWQEGGAQPTANMDSSLSCQSMQKTVAWDHSHAPQNPTFSDVSMPDVRARPNVPRKSRPIAAWGCVSTSDPPYQDSLRHPRSPSHVGPRLVPSLSGVKISNSVAPLLPFARKAGRIGRHLPWWPRGKKDLVKSRGRSLEC